MKLRKTLALFTAFLGLVVSFFAFNNSSSSTTEPTYETNEKVTTSSDSDEFHGGKTSYDNLTDYRWNQNWVTKPHFRVTKDNINSTSTVLKFRVGDYCWITASGGTKNKYIYEPADNRMYGFAEYYLKGYGLWWSKYHICYNSDGKEYWVWGYDGYFTQKCELKLYFHSISKNKDYAQSGYITIKVVGRWDSLDDPEPTPEPEPDPEPEPEPEPEPAPYVPQTVILSRPSYKNSSNHFVYNGKEQGLDLTANDYYFTFDEGTTKKATDVGTYYIRYRCRDGYQMEGRFQTWTIVWYIDNQPLLDDVEMNHPSITWTGEEFESQPVSKNSSDDGKWEIDTEWAYNETKGTNVGSYAVAVKPKKNYCWKDGSTKTRYLTWNIKSIEVNKPFFNSGEDDLHLTYTGVKRGDWSQFVTNYNSDLMDMYIYKDGEDVALEEEPVEAGIYHINFCLKNYPSYCWKYSDTFYYYYHYSPCYYLTVFILRQAVDIPTLNNPNVTYSDSPYVPSFSGFSNLMQTVDFQGETEPGKYKITLELKDKRNYCWADESNYAYYNTDEENNDPQYRTLEYSIGRIKLRKPSINEEYHFSGKNINPIVDDFDENLMTRETTKDQYLTNGYIINIDINDKTHYMWEDETDETFKLEYTIGKASVIQPTIVQTEFNFDNTLKIPHVEGFDSRYMEYANEPSRSTAGVTELVIRLKNKDLSTWSDGTLTDIHFSFTINKQIITPLSIDKEQYVFTGEKIKPVFSSYDSSLVDVIYPEAINPDTYKITLSLKDKINYTWNDGTSEDKYIYFQVVTKPSNSSSVTKNSSSTNPYLGLIIGLTAGSLVLAFIVLVFIAYDKKKKERLYQLKDIDKGNKRL